MVCKHCKFILSILIFLALVVCCSTEANAADNIAAYNSVSVEIADAYYDGITPVTPKVTIKDIQSGYTLKEGTDYSLEYIDNERFDYGYVVITGIGQYYGSQKVQFHVSPDNTKGALEFILHKNSIYRVNGVIPKTLEIPTSVDGVTIESLWGNSFDSISTLCNVIIPESVTSIERTFLSCPNLKSVYIPQSVTSIEKYAFGGSKAFLTIYGIKGSFAEKFASNNSINFVAIDEFPHCHAWGPWYVEREMTCMEDGLELRKCIDCNETVNSRDIISPGKHEYSLWQNQTLPTCTKEGKKIRICAICNDEEFESIEKKEHEYNPWVTTSESTCTMMGKKIRNCVVCNYEECKNIEMKEHEFESWVIVDKPSCTKAGNKKRTCLNCTYNESQDIDAAGHDYIVTKSTTTCSQEGYTVYTCNVCEESYTKYNSFVCGSCDGSGTIDNRKTCSSCHGEGSKTVSEVCSNCNGDKYVTSYKTVTKTCGICQGDLIIWSDTGQKWISCVFCSMTGTVQVEEAQTKLCTKCQGLGRKTQKKMCTSCNGDGKVWGYCAICGGDGSTKRGPCEFSEWTVISKVNCLQNGLEERTCKFCSNVEKKETKATGHIWNKNYSVDVEATCDKDGVKSIHCSQCDQIKVDSRVKINKFGHIEKKDSAVKATFESDGKTQGSHCSRCNKVLISQNTVVKLSSATLSSIKYTYNGNTRKPTVTVKDSNGTVLKTGTDYTVTYASGRKNVGRYKVTITFKGNYSGTKNLYFTIVPKASSSATAKLSTASGGYDDIKFSWKKSTGATGYNVYYKKSSSSKYTFYTATTGTSVTKKNLSDGVKYTFKVVPYYKSGDTKYYSSSQYKTASVTTLKKVTLANVTKNGTKVKVKWKNISGETGYQISKSTTKKGTNIVATYKTTSGTYKSVKATKGKKYYYKVRAYKVVDGKKVYGPWSDVKAFTRK